jgi:hypothetical protein
MRLRFALALLGVLLLLATAALARADRFDGYVAGVGSGRGHDFIVGNGLYLVFRDFGASFTPYRVCWRRSDSNHRRCWQSTTAQRGRRDRIFTAAPSTVGTFVVKWRVSGRLVARWTFYNGPGD